MAWGMLTNGLMDLCRLGFEAYGGKGKESDAPKPQENDELMRATGGGFLWMIGMFSDLQTVPTVADVWAKAQCAIRWPSVWTIAKSLVQGFSVVLMPRTEEVSLVSTVATDSGGLLYRLPVDLNSGKRNLSRVEIIVGTPHGADMLLGGIRSIRAKHPTKPKQEFLAQVLATGTVEEK